MPRLKLTHIRECVAGSRDVGVVQGTSNVANCGIKGGNFVSCGALTQSGFTVNGGSIIQSCSRFDFAGTNAFVSEFSNTFSQLPSTGTSTLVNSTLTLTGAAGVTVNVYNIASTVFSTVRKLIITGAANTWAEINIDGASNTFQSCNTTLFGLTPDRVILNYYETTSLTVQNIGVNVSLLSTSACL